MKRYEITYTVTGYHTEIIEVDDEMTIAEIGDMCYENFPPIESYSVEIEELEDNEDDEE